MTQSNIIEALYRLLAGTGPQGYNKDIRHNLGMDIPANLPNPTTGMTKAPFAGVTGYKPVPVPKDPLAPLLPMITTKPPVAPPPATAAVKPGITDPYFQVLFDGHFKPAWQTSLVQQTGMPRTPPPGR